MLYLTRRKGESFFIGPARVVVISTGAEVRLGIDAPAEMRVTRPELDPPRLPPRPAQTGLDRAA